MRKLWFASAIAILAIAGPAVATTVDLTTAGSSGTLNGALFQQTDPIPTGTGVIDSFVRVSAANQDIEQGYNTDGRPVAYDEITDPNFTRSSARTTTTTTATRNGLRSSRLRRPRFPSPARCCCSAPALPAWARGAGVAASAPPAPKTRIRRVPRASREHRDWPFFFCRIGGRSRSP